MMYDEISLEEGKGSLLYRGVFSIDCMIAKKGGKYVFQAKGFCGGRYYPFLPGR